jgi:predicted  nucleic acid-binding Zn-ribbon protein
MVSCTRYPTEEELNQLDLQIEAADRAEARVAELENEKAKLQRELAAAKQELADHEAEFEEIKRRTSAK